MANETLSTLFIVVATVYSIYILVGLAVNFAYYGFLRRKTKFSLERLKQAMNDRNSDLNKRSFGLNVLMSLAIVLVADHYLLMKSSLDGGMWKFDCASNLYSGYACWPWFASSFLLRVLRIKYQMNLSKIRRQLVLGRTGGQTPSTSTAPLSISAAPAGDEKTNDSPLVLQRIADDAKMLKDIRKYEYWSNEPRLLLFSFVFGIVIFLLNIIVGFIVTPKWYGPSADPELGCDFSKPHNYFKVFVLGGYVLIGLPVCYWALRGSNDAYHLGRNVDVAIKVCTPIYIAYILFSFKIVPAIANFSEYYIALFGLLVVFTAQVILPVYLDIKISEKPKPGNVTKNDFIGVITNDVMFEELKICAMEEFASENLVFYESYCNYMRSAYLNIIDHADTDKADKNAVLSQLFPREIPTENLRAEISKSSATWQKFLTNMDNGAKPLSFSATTSSLGNVAVVDIPMTFEVADILTKIYNRFLVHGAPSELNVPITLTANLMTLLLDLSTRIAAVPIAEAATEKQKAKTVVPNVYLRFSAGGESSATSEKLTLAVQLLDVVRDHTLELVYRNTFVRYQGKVKDVADRL